MTAGNNGVASPHHHNVWLWAFVDVLMVTAVVLCAYTFMVLTSINPPAAQDAAPPPGNIAVSIAWPAGDNDIDLYVAAPNDKPVFYKRKSGKVFDLLRDDLGVINDPTPINAESAFSRGMPDGEYAINVRCYACHEPVTVSVEVRAMTGGKSVLVFAGPIELVRNKQERTAVRFTVKDGAIVPGSLNQIYRRLAGE